jgi:hypothetical protein
MRVSGIGGHDGRAGGHSSFGWTDELIRESLDWLDRWLGPPARRP